VVLTLSLPSSATLQESYQLTELCDRAERVDGPVALDCTNTKRFGPFGIALLASSIALRRVAGRTTTIVRPVDETANEFLTEVGLVRFAAKQATGIGTLEVRELHALDATYTEAVTRMVVNGVPGIDDDTSYTVQLCLNELLQNVFEWSESRVGCLVLARWFHRTRSVRLAVVDRGIGIPAALRRKQISQLHRATDARVIEAAVTTPRLTSRENRVGGLGLKTIREVVCSRKGRLTIVSLGAKVSWVGPKVSHYKAYPLRGTAVEIDFRPGEPVEDPGEHVAVF
jgi:anti-sigma regulatory factor (Ser/Thr protein kinase)